MANQVHPFQDQVFRMWKLIKKTFRQKIMFEDFNKYKKAIVVAEQLNKKQSNLVKPA